MLIQYKKASLLRRGIAFGIDLYIGALFASLPISIISILYLGEISQNVFQMSLPIACFSILLSLICIVFYYFYIPYKIIPGQTLGKRLLDIKFVYKGENIKKALFKRQLLGMVLVEGAFTSGGKLLYQLISILCGYNIVSICSNITVSISLISIGLLMFGSRHLMIHDIIASTEVVEI